MVKFRVTTFILNDFPDEINNYVPDIHNIIALFETVNYYDLYYLNLSYQSNAIMDVRRKNNFLKI